MGALIFLAVADTSMTVVDTASHGNSDRIFTCRYPLVHADV